MQPRSGNDHPLARGPSIAAIGLWQGGNGARAPLLSEAERARLAAVATIVRFKKKAQIYREGDRADAVFNIVEGVVKAYRTLPDKAEHIGAFLFADDLFGLAEEGRYVNSAKAVTAVTAYRIPVPALSGRLQGDATLEYHVICKLCHELREAQRHAMLLGFRSALARLAAFFQLLAQHQTAGNGAVQELYLPMSRSDIAHYVGLSLEAVSRSFRALARRGVLRFRQKRHVSVLDRGKLAALAAENGRAGKAAGRPAP